MIYGKGFVSNWVSRLGGGEKRGAQEKACVKYRVEVETRAKREFLDLPKEVQ